MSTDLPKGVLHAHVITARALQACAETTLHPLRALTEFYWKRAMEAKPGLEEHLVLAPPESMHVHKGKLMCLPRECVDSLTGVINEELAEKTGVPMSRLVVYTDNIDLDTIRYASDHTMVELVGLTFTRALQELIADIDAAVTANDGLWVLRFPEAMIKTSTDNPYMVQVVFSAAIGSVPKALNIA